MKTVFGCSHCQPGTLFFDLAVFTPRVPGRNFWADFRRYHRCLKGRGFLPQFKVRDGFKVKSLKRFLLLLISQCPFVLGVDVRSSLLLILFVCVCLLQGCGSDDGSANADQTLDCRNDELGCTAPLVCRGDDNGGYVCLESDSNGGAAGQGGDAGEGGDSGTQGGESGSGGSAGGHGGDANHDGGNEAGVAGEGGNGSGTTGGGGDGMSNECSRQTLEAALSAELDTVTFDTDFSVYLGRGDDLYYVYNRGASTLDTEYDSASTAKLVTATLVLWVLERTAGFSLQTRPQDVLDFWQIRQRNPLYEITLHHLLSFTSGLNSEPTCVNLGIPRTFSLNDCVSAILQENRSSESIPGEAFHYASTHLQVAGAMAVAASEFESWSALFEAFQAETGLFPNARYDLPSANNPRLAGGMHWTGREYAEFLAALLRGEVISMESLTLMMTSHTSDLPTSFSPTEDEGYPWQYGYGLWIECAETPLCVTSDYRSSPGAYGSYPFFKTDGSFWGIVARQGNLGTFPEGISIGALVRSLGEAWASCPNP